MTGLAIAMPRSVRADGETFETVGVFQSSVTVPDQPRPLVQAALRTRRDAPTVGGGERLRRHGSLGGHCRVTAAGGAFAVVVEAAR